jgi:hypothetical protein
VLFVPDNDLDKYMEIELRIVITGKHAQTTASINAQFVCEDSENSEVGCN